MSQATGCRQPSGGRYLDLRRSRPDGRGAVSMVPAGIKPGDLVYGLRPAIKLYYWLTYTDKDGKMSRPSAVREETLVDMFKEK
jgi:hypothetical protein